ncbi:MAG: DNA polymerase III subunit alpha [Chloroflexi bacterium]|nr:DNA polymerase III subunit alpha [Chloroflexota bacterium]
MFTHLHNHSHYSLLDGMSHIDQLVARAVELGQEAIAITDHGNLYGAIEFYSAAKEAGIKPIIGVEGYVASGKHTTRDPNDRFPFHLTILARNEAGYRNLLQLVSKSHLDGFYYRPRMDRDLLEKHSDGLIVLSGCPSGEMAKMITSDRMDEAREVAEWYRGVFGDHYYLELMSHDGVEQLPKINSSLIALSGETGIPLVATNDSHYVYREDQPLQDLLLCIQTNSTVDDPKRMKFEGDSFYLKSEEEMAALWPDNPEAIANTQRIADSCDLTIEFGRSRLPRYPTPDSQTSIEYVTSLCSEGLARRYPNVTDEIEERLAYELEVIDKTGFADYFLAAKDIGDFAHDNGILMGVRGSAAASVVLYTLGVTDIDPIETGLVFERFLNLERREMPDIDFDFQDDRRGEVIKWAAERYGEGHVAQIVTFGTMGAKAAVRDVGRAMGMDYGEVDEVAKLIPSRLGTTLASALDETPDLVRLIDSNDRYRALIDSARGLEGTVRHASTHAAAVVITEDPLTDVVPLQRATSGEEGAIPATMYSMDPVAKLGLLKMDFLGLTNLTILDRAIKLIKERQDIDLSLDEIPLDDQATFEMLGEAETFGVFQLESDGMRRYVKDLKPTSVADISAMIALYRPGPMEHIPKFIDSKHGRQEITYPHEDLKPILEETYGIIVYQDQVLLIAQAFGGYTLGEADILRKSMGKKDPEIMAAEREKFVSGASAKGYPEELANTMFELIEPFAGYAFNKAHSASYAMIAYWTAFLKANYRVEYMVALLDAASGNPERLAAAVRETRRLGIRVFGPDVNLGGVGFSAGAPGNEENREEDSVRFGMAAVKNVGPGAVQPIIDERRAAGPFKSIEELCKRVKFQGMNRRTLESLMKVGTFDSLASRAALLESVDRILALIQREAKLRDSGQTTMFDLLGDEVPTPAPDLGLTSQDDVNENERILWERDLLGVEITESAFSREMLANAEHFIVFASQVTGDRNGEKVGLLGQIRRVRELSTKRGETFLAVSVGMLDGEIEVVVWPNVLATTSGLWKDGKFVSVMGQIRERDGRVSVSANEVREYRYAGEGASPSTSAMEEQVEQRPEEASIEPHAGPGPGQAAANSDVNSSGPARSSNGAANGAYHVGIGNSASSIGESAARVHGLMKGGNSNGDGAKEVTVGLIVRVVETDHPREDRYQLEDLVKTLLNFRGDEAVTLEIKTAADTIKMEMPFVHVRSCPELTDRLTEMLGSENVRPLA